MRRTAAVAYEPRTRPRAHQAEALRRVAAHPTRPSDADVFAWLMDLGTGKSKVVLDEYGTRELAGDLFDLFNVAPAGAYRNWDLDRGPTEPSEIRKHLSPDLFGRLRVYTWVSGRNSKKERAEREDFLRHQGPRFLNMNAEALSAVKEAREFAAAFLRSSRGCMMNVDESSFLMRHNSIRTDVIINLGALAKARRICTGLLSPNTPLDIFYQFEFLDWRILGQRSFYGFRARYAVIQRVKFASRPRPVPIVVGYRNLDELQRRIAPYSYRVLKKDCLDITEPVYTWRDVEMTDEQRRIYADLKRDATAHIAKESYVTATMVLTQLLRLDQLLCGFVVDELGDLHEVPENRTRAMMELLAENGGKAVIWTTHDYCIRKLAAVLRKEYGKKSTAMFWGGNRATRQEDEARFKTDPDCRFIISTQMAGGRGNTWIQGAPLAVYYNNSHDLEHRDNSEARTHRDGLVGDAVYCDLVVRGTSDEKKIMALRKKIDMATVITGENYREWLI